MVVFLDPLAQGTKMAHSIIGGNKRTLLYLISNMNICFIETRFKFIIQNSISEPVRMFLNKAKRKRKLLHLMEFEAHTLQILCPKPCNANQYSAKCNFKVALRALSYSKFYNSKAKKEQCLMGFETEFFGSGVHFLAT